MKRRFLVLTDEAVRHPFRAGLAPDRLGQAQRRFRKKGITAQAVREFLLAYCACLLAVSLYIA